MLTTQDINSMNSFIVFIPKGIDIEKRIEEKWDEIHSVVLGNRYKFCQCLNDYEKINVAKSYLLHDLECIRDNNNFEMFDSEELIRICEILGFYITGTDSDIFIQNIAYGEMLKNIKKLLIESLG